MTPPTPADSSPEERVVAAWIALLRAGAPTDCWFPRSIWDNALRVVAEVSSQPALRYHTRAAKDFKIVDVQRGRGKPGKVQLLEPGHPGQFIPFLDGVQPAELLPDSACAEQTTT